VIVAKKSTKRVVILIRSIEIEGEKHLAMIDSKGNIDIDSLTTNVEPGVKIIWRLERLSGIKEIINVYPTEREERKIFEKNPKKRCFCKGFKLKLPKDIGDRGKEIKETYAIKYIDWEDEEVTIDPYIRIPPIEKE
jgi:hypothetical protein